MSYFVENLSRQQFVFDCRLNISASLGSIVIIILPIVLNNMTIVLQLKSEPVDSYKNNSYKKTVYSNILFFIRNLGVWSALELFIFSWKNDIEIVYFYTIFVKTVNICCLSPETPQGQYWSCLILGNIL